MKRMLIVMAVVVMILSLTLIPAQKSQAVAPVVAPVIPLTSTCGTASTMGLLTNYIGGAFWIASWALMAADVTILPAIAYIQNPGCRSAKTLGELSECIQKPAKKAEVAPAGVSVSSLGQYGGKGNSQIR
jgi:hypothetical protein